MEMQELDIVGKVVWVRSDTISRQSLDTLRTVVMANGGLEVLCLGKEVDLQTKTIDEALELLKAMKRALKPKSKAKGV